MKGQLEREGLERREGQEVEGPLAQLANDAVAALERVGISRRNFLKGSGALIVTFSVAELADHIGISSVAAQRLDGAGSNQLDAWIAIGTDGNVTAYTGKCELGHGLYTAQTQLIAEELSVPFNRVRLIQCDTALTPDQGTTSGAQSHPTNFNQANLALAGATTRAALLQRASARLGFSVDQLVVKDGIVSAKTDPSKSVSYGELVGGQKFAITLNPAARRKHPREWTVLGTSVPRVEFPAIVTGQFEYVHNVRVPGMLHGRVIRPPAVGATLIAVDEASVQALPGVVKVVVKKNFVGVVAEKPWQAMQAVSKLKVDWTPGTGLPSHDGFREYLRSQKATRDTLVVNSKDVDEKTSRAARVVKATYHYPYQMHGSVGSACAVADVQSERATIWSASQAVYPLKSTAAMVLGLQPENVRIIFRMGPGCYGCNGADPVSYDAAILSQAVGKPVRVQLTRKDEMAWENYGFAFVIDERVGLDADGTIIAWDHESWSPTLGGRPGGNQPGNVVSGFLAGFQPGAFAARTPAPDPTNFGNGSNAVPSYVTGCVGDRCGGTGTVVSQRVLTHNIRSPFFTGPLRSPERLQNTFAHESFIDEVAATIKADPVAYRLRHLRDPRLAEVVSAAAKAARWQARPSPIPDRRRNGIVTGRGISCVLYEGDNGYCALVAEVSVDQDSGRVTVKRLVIANDCGPISNPDGLKNQLEGGALQGISRALLEEVTWDDQKVTSIDWRTYRPLYLGAEVPMIETVLINRPDERATGAGETAVTVTPAAIANAIFDATGARLRQVPFTPERVKAALTVRT
ncbi:MAG: xanthine dehydrogenase family protein molybdopterin-binding subunit [Blastocatellia bacterium]|nr:MAG: xanthine dehydrogenase family protein molybdopterin-binding subunit [Blastocatellia bacterium]